MRTATPGTRNKTCDKSFQLRIAHLSHCIADAQLAPFCNRIVFRNLQTGGVGIVYLLDSSLEWDEAWCACINCSWFSAMSWSGLAGTLEGRIFHSNCERKWVWWVELGAVVGKWYDYYKSTSFYVPKPITESCPCFLSWGCRELSGRASTKC